MRQSDRFFPCKYLKKSRWLQKWLQLITIITNVRALGWFLYIHIHIHIHMHVRVCVCWNLQIRQVTKMKWKKNKIQMIDFGVVIQSEAVGIKNDGWWCDHSSKNFKKTRIRFPSTTTKLLILTIVWFVSSPILDLI